MTEQEWLTCEDPRAMYARIISNGPASVSVRRWRLLACAIQQTQLSLLPYENHEQVKDVIDDAIAWAESGQKPAHLGNNAYYVLMDPAFRGVNGLIRLPVNYPNIPEVDKKSADLFREVIGNPFRSLGKFVKCEACNGRGGINHHVPVDMDTGTYTSINIYCDSCLGDGMINTWKRWLTPTVLSIAQQIYATQDYAGMPILADAMEEAGCEEQIKCKRCKGTKWIHRRTPDDEGFGRMTVTDPCPDCRATGMVCNPILEHLRGSNTHVRGCWALDLILGKE